MGCNFKILIFLRCFFFRFPVSSSSQCKRLGSTDTTMLRSLTDFIIFLRFLLIYFFSQTNQTLMQLYQNMQCNSLKRDLITSHLKLLDLSGQSLVRVRWMISTSSPGKKIRVNIRIFLVYFSHWISHHKDTLALLTDKTRQYHTDKCKLLLQDSQAQHRVDN